MNLGSKVVYSGVLPDLCPDKCHLLGVEPLLVCLELPGSSWAERSGLDRARGGCLYWQDCHEADRGNRSANQAVWYSGAHRNVILLPLLLSPWDSFPQHTVLVDDM